MDPPAGEAVTTVADRMLPRHGKQYLALHRPDERVCRHHLGRARHRNLLRHDG